MADDILTQNTTMSARDRFRLAAMVFALAERAPEKLEPYSAAAARR